MFVLQLARVKAPGGIHTAVAHYERMFRSTGVRSALLFRGPAATTLNADAANILELPALASAPWAARLPLSNGLQRDVRNRANGEPLAVLVHSDLALPRVRHLFPEAVIVAPCHSDKTKHKHQADLVVTLNATQQQAVSAALPRTRVTEIGNPFVPPVTRTPIALANATPRLNFIGRFEGFKDPLTLVEAFAAARLPDDIELRLIGAGRMDREVREASAHAPRRVTLAGWLEHPFSEFRSNDVLVLPSLWESYSYVIREALDLGVPIIASDIPVHRAALGEGAFGDLFPPGDCHALATILERAITDVPRLRQMSEKGGEALRARYGAKPFWAALRNEIEWVLATRAQ